MLPSPAGAPGMRQKGEKAELARRLHIAIQWVARADPKTPACKMCRGSARFRQRREPSLGADRLFGLGALGFAALPGRLLLADGGSRRWPGPGKAL